MSSSTIAVGWVVAPRCQGISSTLSTSVHKESVLRQKHNKVDLPRQRFFQNVGRLGTKRDAVIVLGATKQSKPFSCPIVCVLNHSKLRRVRSNLRCHHFDGSAMFAIQQVVRGRTKIFLKEFCRNQRICTSFPRFCQQPGTVYSQENLQKDDLITSDISKVYAGNKVTDPSSKPLPVIETYTAGRIYVHSNPIPPLISDDYSSQNASRHSFSSLPDRCPSDLPDADTPVETLLEKEAWDLLRQSVVNYCGSPVGTVAANDPTDPCPLNYDQVFLRDFIPSAIAFLLKGESEIVRNFILHTLQLQSWEKTVDCYSPGQGLMPASFKVRMVPLEGGDANATEEILDPDFGESAIGRVAPVDSGLWWIILLRAYGKCTGDFALQERVDVQTGMKLILKLCLADGFDMFPTLLVTDASCMIDRRMGIHGHPLEIQALFYAALRCAREMMKPEDGAQDIIRAINSRLSALSFHIREYYWVDLRKLNEIYRYKTEEYSYDAVNKFNIYPDQISSWLVEWMPDQGGYFIGNLQPAHMDFRFFSLGNLWAIAGSLATPEQAEAILDLIEARWNDFVGNMPFKICFPALQYEEWRIITGSDPKNTSWSYHNGGSWPTLVWQFTVACIKMRRLDLATKCLEVLEKRISKDRWPEYYDTRTARFIGKQARLYQTWSVAGYLVAKTLLQNPEAASILTFEEDVDLLAACCCSTEASPSRKRCRKI